MTSSLFVATVEHHTQEEAAACPEAAGLPYLGVWHTPEPEPAAVHVFGEVEPGRLRLAGWTPDRSDYPLQETYPGSGIYE